MAELEYRSTLDWPEQDMELRAVSDTGLTFRGYAAAFDSMSEDLGGFREVIRPGAFAKTLRERRGQVMLWNHRDDKVLARTTARTLRLSEDERGLLVEADLPDNEWGRPVADAIRRGDVTSMSFGFAALRDVPPRKDTPRELIEVRLYEVSPVIWPAYQATSATVRHLSQVAGIEEDEIEAAFAALRGSDPLSDEHRDVLIKTIHARSATRYVTATAAAEIAERRTRLALLAAG